MLKQIKVGERETGYTDRESFEQKDRQSTSTDGSNKQTTTMLGV